MVGEPVEQSGGHLGVSEHGRPLAEGEVRRDDDRGPLIKPADQMEEKLAAGLREREIAKLVHDDEVEPGNEVGQPALFALACFRLKPVDEIDDVVEAPTRAVAKPERNAMDCRSSRHAEAALVLTDFYAVLPDDDAVGIACISAGRPRCCPILA